MTFLILGMPISNSHPSLSEAKALMRRWNKGTFDTVADSIRYHHETHSGGRNVWQYLRAATHFNKRGTRKRRLPDGRIRWKKGNGEFLIENQEGKIVSYGPPLQR
ncbi:hypothetical protein HYR99_21125 [Candidatus Poribacteria bacterium]|nr:hypothetical protein [Candidatus Poribacteria bacterium]